MERDENKIPNNSSISRSVGDHRLGSAVERGLVPRPGGFVRAVPASDDPGHPDNRRLLHLPNQQNLRRLHRHSNKKGVLLSMFKYQGEAVAHTQPNPDRATGLRKTGM